MCKYCKFKNEEDWEKENDFIIIDQIRDGRQQFALRLNRYECEGDKNTVLAMHYSIYHNGTEHYELGDNLETKEIQIKYCPFCGEEL